MTRERKSVRTGRYGYSVWTGILVGAIVALAALVVFSLAIVLADHHHIAGVLYSPLLNRR